MSGWIANRSEASLEESRVTFMLRLLGFGLKGIEGEQGLIDGEDKINQNCAIGVDIGELANPLGKTL